MPDMSKERRYQMLITDGARADLGSCRAGDRWAAAKVAEFLREFSDGRSPSELLVDEHFFDEEVRDVSAIWSLQDKRINAYRIRLVEVSGWRIITAVDHRAKRVAVLAIMPRTADYEADRDLWARIEREHDAIGFARYG